MGYTNFNMRLDNALKASAYPVFEQYGLTASQAVRLFFNQVAKTGKLPLSLDFDVKEIDHEKNPITMQAVQEFKRGDVQRYQSFNDFLEEIENETD
jgi:addiction module RelB/DinJ family antitoxin